MPLINDMVVILSRSSQNNITWTQIAHKESCGKYTQDFSGEGLFPQQNPQSY